MTTLRLVMEWALRSSVVILAGAILLPLFRVKSASVRLAVWVAMLCASLTIPILTVALPALPLPATRAPQIIALHPSPADHAAAAPAEITSPAMTLPTAIPAATRFDWLRIAAVAYAAVAGVLLLRLGIGLVIGMRLASASRKTGLIFEGIEVCESDRVAVPVTVGIFRSIILLPDTWREWDVTKRQAVLAHERSHVRRKDPAVQLVSSIHRALLWFTPLSWFLHSRIVRTAEAASDDAALAVVQDRASYAGILLDFMRESAPTLAWEGVSMARYGSPEQRIRRILNGTLLSRQLTIGSTLAIAALVAPLTCVVAAAHSRPAMTVPPVAPAAQADPVAPAATSGAIPEVQSVPAASASPASAASSPSSATSPAARPIPRAQSNPATPAAAAAPTTTATAQTSSTQPSDGAIRRYIVVHGTSMSGSWGSEDDVKPEELRSRFGDNFAWFRQGGHEYVITDAGVMGQLEAAMEPQKRVNRMQAGVNAEQARVNAMQSKVNAHQNEVNALQNVVNRKQNLVNELQAAVNHGNDAALIDKLETALKNLRAADPQANQDGVNRIQSQVNSEQAAVNAEQHKVNELQSKVNDEQRVVSEEERQRMQEIFISALRNGTAKQLN